MLNLPIGDNDTTKPLPKNSFVRCHRLATVSSVIIQKKISEVKPDFLEEVVDAVNLNMLDIQPQSGDEVTLD
jgi:hypothetical protein